MLLTAHDVVDELALLEQRLPLDAQVWARVEEVLTNPQVIANEVTRLRDVDPTGPNIGALDKRIAQVDRQRTNLMRRIATIDDDDMAAPFLVEIQMLGRA